jgi:hypothetical protein
MSHWNCPNKTIIGGSGCRLHKYTLQSCSTDYRAWSSNANAVCERRRRERKCRPLLPFLICWRDALQSVHRRPGGRRYRNQETEDFTRNSRNERNWPVRDTALAVPVSSLVPGIPAETVFTTMVHISTSVYSCSCMLLDLLFTCSNARALN